MNNTQCKLEQLKQTHEQMGKDYEDIGNKIKALEDELKQEQYKYPIFMKRKASGVVVRLTSLTEGTIVIPGDSLYKAGTVDTWIAPHTDKAAWEPVPTYRGIPHKALAWCWNDNWTHKRILIFIDAINKCTYTCDRQRNGDVYDNCELYEGEWPEWAKKSYKTLKD